MSRLALSLSVLLFSIEGVRANIDEIDESSTLNVCTLDQEQELYASYLSNDYVDRNPALYKSIVQAVKEYQAGKLQIIDVREQAEYAEYRVPRSLNIPLSMIEHKGFLKKKNLLVLNDGTQFTHLEKTVEGLRQKGFSNIFLLDGGLKRWAYKTSYIDGKHTPLKYNTLSVKEFLAESKLGPWLVVELGEKGSFTEDVNGSVVNIQLDDTFLLSLSSYLREYGSDLTRTVFVTSDKSDIKQLESYLEQSDFSNLFILKNTIDYIPIYKKESLIAYQKRNKPSVVECLIE